MSAINSISAQSEIYLNPFKLLIVEDHRVIQFAITNMLEALGYCFDIASNGKEAIQLAKKRNDYSLILMDIDLPDMSGIEVTQALLSIENTQNVPIVAMTSHTELDYKVRCYSTGMVGYYGKPRGIADIQTMIVRHVIRKRPEIFAISEAVV